MVLKSEAGVGGVWEGLVVVAGYVSRNLALRRPRPKERSAVDCPGGEMGRDLCRCSNCKTCTFFIYIEEVFFTHLT